MDIHINQLHKYFNHFHVLDNINLNITSGALVALLGPSGCGKTTLLRLIAGLEYADEGTIYFNERDMTRQPAQVRKVGFMFQHYALFRHMNVFDNVAFGLQVLPRKHRPSKTAIAEKVHELLTLVQLDWLVKAYPQQLSGGQRQRIALARALATEPKLLLLDEPFGALDAKVRKELRQWLRTLHQRLGITSILVTHDQDEALEIADQLVVMNQGHIEQYGSSTALYHQPENVFVAEFLGEVNVFEDACIEQGRLWVGQYWQTMPQFSDQRQNVRVYVRPHELAVFTTAQDNTIDCGQIMAIQTMGTQIRLRVKRSALATEIQILLSPAEFRTLALQLQQRIWFAPNQLIMFRLPEMVEYVI